MTARPGSALTLLSARQSLPQAGQSLAASGRNVAALAGGPSLSLILMMACVSPVRSPPTLHVALSVGAPCKSHPLDFTVSLGPSPGRLPRGCREKRHLFQKRQAWASDPPVARVPVIKGRARPQVRDPQCDHEVSGHPRPPCPPGGQQDMCLPSPGLSAVNQSMREVIYPPLFPEGLETCILIHCIANVS